MGVLGLWKLIDATGKPVPLETLEGKVLAIDVSIWIHQVIQGYQDRRGNSLPNAHLIGLFNRLCKLMYYKIKPVFVFDGGVPLLKKNTIATRRKLKSIAANKAQRLKNDLINNLIKHTAVKGVLEKENNDEESTTLQQFKNTKDISNLHVLGDMYKLPDIPSTSELIDSDNYTDSDEENQLKLSPRKQSKWIGNIHSVDVNNEEFKSLPADVRYDILTDLKETRKQSSWGRIHELPSGSHNYSGFQVNRLLKRRYVQESLEAAEKEMGGRTFTLDELDKLLTDQGINTTLQKDDMFRIASDSKTRVIYLKNVQDKQSNNNTNNSDTTQNQQEQNEQNQYLINTFSDSMSVNSDDSISMVDNLKAYDLEDEWISDNDMENTLNDSKLQKKHNIPKSVMNPALAYMLENSGLTKDQIIQIVEQHKKNKTDSDGSSSCTSSKTIKRKSNRLSVFNKKKKLSYDCKDNESLKLKKNENEQKINSTELLSESEEFINVSEESTRKVNEIENLNSDQIIAKESSDESDDFIEVQDVPIPELSLNKKSKNDCLEITVKTDKNCDVDMFADVFADIGTINKSDTLSEKECVSKEKVKTISIKSKSSTEFDDKYEPIAMATEIKHENDEKIPLASTTKNSEFESSHESFSDSKHKIVSNVDMVQNLSDTNIIKDTVDNEKNIEIKKQNDSINMEELSIQKQENRNSTADVSICSEIVNTIENINKSSLDNVQENENDLKHVGKKGSLNLTVNEKELETMKQQLEMEQQEITGNLGKLERQAIDITDQMRLEAQELLRLFGVPYIVAPMEAEAQCAYLEQIKLTDGTITDDSDIWLFGGHCVYKNFFDNNKKVLQFLSKDIEHHFKLSRKEMIQLALLVGSDYTNGLTGVGPVTALEILAAFPSDEQDFLYGLRTFTSWFRAGKLVAPGKTSLRNKLKNVQIEKGFPSQAVVQAYLSPVVDESKEAFSWGKPNLVLLADYVKQKFGWTKLKFDEIITPVMKRLNESQSQKGIESYFKVQHIPKSIEANLSKRVQSAVQKLSFKSVSDENSENEALMASKTTNETEKLSKTVKKRSKKSQTNANKLSIITEVAEENSKIDTSCTEDKNVTEDKLHVEEVNKKVNVIQDSENTKTKRKIIIPDTNTAIPQRERDKVNALKTKLRAIEIYRKSKKGLGCTQKKRKAVMKIKKEAELSESSDSS